VKAAEHLRGYVLISLKGENPQKAVNMAMARGLAVWDMCSKASGYWELKTTVEGFRAMSRLARRSGCRIRIIKKFGLPFLLKRLGRRKAFMAGAVFFCIGLFVLSRFVWSVDVRIAGNYNPAVILEAAQRQGVYPGCLRSSLDTGRFQKAMQQEFPDISWAGLHFQGTRITVEVVEKREGSVTEGMAGDLVAGETGLIKEILVLKGIAKVREGDRVVPGQILIEGLRYPERRWTQDGRWAPEGDPVRIQSQGLVRAEVTRESYGECPVEEVEMIETGREKVSRTLIIFNKPIHLTGSGRVPFEYAREITERKIVYKGRNHEQIIEINTVTQKEQKRVVHSWGVDGAYEQALARARADLRARLPADAQVTAELYDMENPEAEGLVRLRLTVITLENIGFLLNR
jgi:similar to stage IV sporulation protein